jgi:hypothetical protein
MTATAASGGIWVDCLSCDRYAGDKCSLHKNDLQYVEHQVVILLPIVFRLRVKVHMALHARLRVFLQQILVFEKVVRVTVEEHVPVDACHLVGQLVHCVKVMGR